MSIVAEDQADVDDARRRGYPGPLERLLSLDALPPGSILAHGVRLSRDEVRRAADAGCWFVHNPRSNEGNRVGYAGALSAAKRVALGHRTAGTPTWPRKTRRSDASPSRTATRTSADGLRRASALAAERFGAEAEPLAPGSLGDLVVRRNGAVRHVVVGGRVVVENGVLATADAESIAARARAEATRLWSRMAAI